MLLIEIIQPTSRSVGPWNQSFLLNSLAASLVGLVQIKSAYPFPVSIDYRCHTVIGIHAMRITDNFRECRHPVLSSLLGNPQIGFDNIPLHLCFYQSPQRMCATVGIPNPIIRIKRLPFIIVYLTIRCTIITPILAQTNRAFIATIQRGIENDLVIFTSAFHFNLAQCTIPDILRSFSYDIHIICGNLAL